MKWKGEAFSKFRGVPPAILLITAGASYLAQVVAALAGWPLWALVLATIVPWVPILTKEIAWTYRHYGWLALFYVLTLTQVGHVGEHMVQMFQIHVLNISPAEAHGVFGALDIEWVHFLWNTWVALAVVALLTEFRKNLFLWATFVIASFHLIEHFVMLSAYLKSGRPGSPGLLAAGGLLGGGLPATRPDLHFAYNLVETIPLVIAFGVQLSRSYNGWLAKAFPTLPVGALKAATKKLTVRRFSTGEVILRQGERPAYFYVIAKGRVEVSRERDSEVERLGFLQRGQYFGGLGLISGAESPATVRVDQSVEVLELERPFFREILEAAPEFERDLHNRSPLGV